MTWLINLLSGGAASKVAGGITNIAGLIALAPAAIWFVNHKDEVFTTVTYGQAALVGGLIFAVLKIAHYSRPPGT